MFFILLCVVFLLAYGVAAQSLLYPNAEPSFDILYNVVYHPYFSMYQEFPLDELEGIGHFKLAFILRLHNSTQKSPRQCLNVYSCALLISRPVMIGEENKNEPMSLYEAALGILSTV